MITKEKIEKMAATQNGDYIGKTFGTLDGKDAAEFLQALGYEIAEFHDAGRNGLATTKCGLCLSTNGHVGRR